MNRTSLLLAISTFAMPLAAVAQTPAGPYFGIAAGFNKMRPEDVDVHADGSPAAATPGTIKTSVGPALVASLGTRIATALRLEVEGSFRTDHIDGETGLAGENNATGTERKMGLMANVLYDFTAGSIRPYVGGGAGGQWVHEPAATSNNGGVTVTSVAQTQGSFAYQAIAGLAYPSVHGMSLTGEYRYMGLAGARKYHATATVPGLGSFPLTDESTDNWNHSLLFGIRYNFGK